MQYVQASVELTFAGLKPAVALGGIDCATVVDAATEVALVVEIWALATAARTEAAMTDRDSILMDVMWCEMMVSSRCLVTWMDSEREEAVCARSCQWMQLAAGWFC